MEKGAEGVNVGRYTLERKPNGSLWIRINNGEYEGEGMEVDEKIFEIVINEFYNEVF